MSRKKPRCPKCGAVARALYERVGASAVPRSVADAARCPDCERSFLLRAAGRARVPPEE